MHADIRAPSRSAPATRQLVNPLWWLGDEMRPVGWSPVAWFVRNPCANMFHVVIGIAHRSRLVVWSRGDGWTLASSGWNWGYSRTIGGAIPLPFVSFRGRRWESIVGWKTSGAFAPFTLRRANSPNAEPAP